VVSRSPETALTLWGEAWRKEPAGAS